MSLEQFGIVVGILTGLAGLVCGAFGVMHSKKTDTAQFAERLAKLELKVDTVWDFLVRRAFGEAVQKGVGTMNSPFTLTAEALEWLADLKEDLQELYQGLPKPLSDSDLMLEIEKRYGADIVTKICVPYELSQGTCLLIAAAVARDKNSVELPVAQPPSP